MKSASVTSVSRLWKLAERVLFSAEGTLEKWRFDDAGRGGGSAAVEAGP